MSNSAAMAAAKRRQVPAPTSTSSSRTQPNTNKKLAFEQQLQNTPESQKRYSVVELLKMHDYKLFSLEKEIRLKNVDNNDFITKHDLEQLQMESSVSTKLDNKTLNKIDGNCSDLSALKNTVSTLNKSMQNANSLITMMKATLLSQSNELKELRDAIKSESEKAEEYEEATVEMISSTEEGDEVEEGDVSPTEEGHVSPTEEGDVSPTENIELVINEE